MTLETFTPPFEPSVGNSTQTDTRSLSAEFGEGYSQRAGDGLNGVKKTLPLVWNGLTVAEADEIDAFFTDHRGYIAFLYTAPRDVTPKKWIVKNWQRPHIDVSLDQFTATLEQVFDL